MKVSELIEQAQAILEKHGDIKITTHTPGESEFHQGWPVQAFQMMTFEEADEAFIWGGDWGWSEGDKIAVLVLGLVG